MRYNVVARRLDDECGARPVWYVSFKDLTLAIAEKKVAWLQGLRREALIVPTVTFDTTMLLLHRANGDS